jgi:hypothetical protein
MSEDRTEYKTSEPDNRLVWDMPFDLYQAQQGINASSIAHGRKSMLHMHHAMTTHSEATAAMMFGTLAHYVVLEGGAGLVCCDARRGTKAWQAAIDEANGNERMVCKPDEYEQVIAMRDAVMAHGEARWIIEATKHEVSGFWTGDYGKAKMRADMLGSVEASGKMILADYKTTGDIEPRRFFSTAERLAYHVKMGWYAEGCEAITGKTPDVYMIIQEQKAPHDVFVAIMPAAIVEQGREEAIEIAMKYRIADECGIYQGVEPDSIVEYERPAWVLGGENAEVNMEGCEV